MRLVRRLVLALVLLLGGCKFKDEAPPCPEINDHGKKECLDYGAVYVEVTGHIYCLTNGGIVMERK